MNHPLIPWNPWRFPGIPGDSLESPSIPGNPWRCPGNPLAILWNPCGNRRRERGLRVTFVTPDCRQVHGRPPADVERVDQRRRQHAAAGPRLGLPPRTGERRRQEFRRLQVRRTRSGQSGEGHGRGGGAADRRARAKTVLEFLTGHPFVIFVNLDFRCTLFSLLYGRAELISGFE